MRAESIKISLKKVLLSGLFVGTLDILAAFMDVYIAGGNPLIVLNFIATGAFGKTTLSLGNTGAVAGLIFHYIIAYSFTFFFFWLYPKIEILHKSWLLTGLLYGIFIWLVMNLIVVRLSHIQTRPISSMQIKNILKGALILICMIGWPLAFIAHNASGKKA